MYLICFICFSSYLEGKPIYCVRLSDLIVLLHLSRFVFYPGILPTVLSSNELPLYDLIRHSRSTQTQDLKTTTTIVGSGVNNVHLNNKSQIVLLTENSTEINDGLIFKEQYELQNETGTCVMYFNCN